MARSRATKEALDRARKTYLEKNKSVNIYVDRVLYDQLIERLDSVALSKKEFFDSVIAMYLDGDFTLKFK